MLQSAPTKNTSQRSSWLIIPLSLLNPHKSARLSWIWDVPPLSLKVFFFFSSDLITLQSSGSQKVSHHQSKSSHLNFKKSLAEWQQSVCNCYLDTKSELQLNVGSVGAPCGDEGPYHGSHCVAVTDAAREFHLEKERECVCVFMCTVTKREIYEATAECTICLQYVYRSWKGTLLHLCIFTQM